MEELLGRRFLGQVVCEARDPKFGARFALDAHVYLTGRILADFYDRKAGRDAVLAKILHLACDVLFNLVGNGFSVDDFSCHRAVDVPWGRQKVNLLNDL